MNSTNKNEDKNLTKGDCIASDSRSTDLGRWAELPSSVLEQVFSYLGKGDQFHGSLVCQNWSYNYGSPCLWKTFIIDLSKNYPVELWPPLKFARRFGFYFKHIVIKGEPRLRKKKIIKTSQQLKIFFETIARSKCQLLSIKFKNMYDYNRHLNEREYTNFVQSILTFMNSQENLRTIEFHNCYFNTENGLSFPRLICESIANTLSTLVLKGREGNYNSDLVLDYGIVLQNLRKLNILRTDYTINFEKTLKYFCEKIRHPSEMTKKISLIELYFKPEDLKTVIGISEENWIHLVHLCPNTKFQLIFYNEHNTKYIFVQYTPLVKVEFKIESISELGEEIEDLFRYLTLFKGTENLEHIIIIWKPRIRNIRKLKRFLKKCKTLKYIEITLNYPVTGLEDVFNYLHISPPVSLESAIFTILVTDEEDRNRMSLLADMYRPLLEHIGQIFIKYIC